MVLNERPEETPGNEQLPLGIARKESVFVEEIVDHACEHFLLSLHRP
jgi:hypothetical protein